MRRLALIALPLAISGCFYPADRGRLLETRLEKLETTQTRLQEELQQARAQVDALTPLLNEKIAEVSRLSAALRDLNELSHKTGADVSLQVQQTVRDVDTLRGQLETYLHKVDTLEAALSKTSEDTDKRLLELKGEQAQRDAEARKKAEELKRPTDKKDFLQLAQDKAKAGDVALARQLYSEFLKKWPKDALAAEAHFGLGESYFGEDKCREALFEYGKLLQDYPKADSTPDAYLRSSECFKQLKMQDESRLALEELIKGFPKTDAAKKARERLAELDKARKADSKKGGKK